MHLQNHSVIHDHKARFSCSSWFWVLILELNHLRFLLLCDIMSLIFHLYAKNKIFFLPVCKLFWLLEDKFSIKQKNWYHNFLYQEQEYLLWTYLFCPCHFLKQFWKTSFTSVFTRCDFKKYNEFQGQVLSKGKAGLQRHHDMFSFTFTGFTGSGNTWLVTFSQF